MRSRKQQTQRCDHQQASPPATTESEKWNGASGVHQQHLLKKIRLPATMLVSGSVLIFLAYRYFSYLSFLRLLTLTPVALAAYPVMQPGRPIQQKIIPTCLILAVVSAQLPVFIASALAVTSVMVFTLITEPPMTTFSAANSDTSSNHPPQKAPRGPTFVSALSSIVLMIAVLLIENFLIWVVSATFLPGQTPSTAPPPLQDNGQILMHKLLAPLTKREVISLRRLWNTQWALVASLAASFLVAEKFHSHRTLFSVATRAMLTVALARTIRTISFLLTVVPSQVVGCYAQRFPLPPPPDTWEWIYVGLQPRSHGGCNDLIVSGHATITATLACVSTSLANENGGCCWFAVAIWSMVVLDYAVEIYEGFHYSVDMWLGGVLVVLIWRVMGFVERDLGRKEQSTGALGRQGVGRRALVYSPAAVLTYLQMTVLPEATANFIILGVVAMSLWIFVRHVWNQQDMAKKSFYIHNVQHAFLCLLILALGIYL